jgi:hypothetical protein
VLKEEGKKERKKFNDKTGRRCKYKSPQSCARLPLCISLGPLVSSVMNGSLRLHGGGTSGFFRATATSEPIYNTIKQYFGSIIPTDWLYKTHAILQLDECWSAMRQILDKS